MPLKIGNVLSHATLGARCGSCPYFENCATNAAASNNSYREGGCPHQSRVAGLFGIRLGHTGTRGECIDSLPPLF